MREPTVDLVRAARTALLRALEVELAEAEYLATSGLPQVADRQEELRLHVERITAGLVALSKGRFEAGGVYYPEEHWREPAALEAHRHSKFTSPDHPLRSIEVPHRRAPARGLLVPSSSSRLSRTGPMRPNRDRPNGATPGSPMEPKTAAPLAAAPFCV